MILERSSGNISIAMYRNIQKMCLFSGDITLGGATCRKSNGILWHLGWNMSATAETEKGVQREQTQES